MNTPSILWSILLACTAGVRAQTYVVAAGGGGQFTSLQQAIDTVPTGATLHVKPGAYSEFTIQGKSLTILADGVGQATVTLVTGTTISGITAPGRVHISGLSFSGPASAYTQISVSACAGGVVLDRIATSGCVQLSADQCDDLHLLGWIMANASTTLFPSASPPRIRIARSKAEIADSVVNGWTASALASGGTGIQIEQGSTVMLSASSVSGGLGSSNFGSSGGSGGDAVFASGGSFIHVFGNGPFGATTPCALHGGNGGSGTGSAGFGGRGGDGLSLATGCSARVFGANLSGGTHGSGVAGAGRNGQPIFLDATSSADQQPGATGPSGFLSGTMGQGLTVKFALRGAPATPAVLLLGLTSTFALSPFALGAVGVSPLATLDGLVLPTGGLLEVPIQVPVSWPADTVVLAQFWTLDAGRSELQASNVFSAITR